MVSETEAFWALVNQPIWLGTVGLLFGLAIGSFLNVVIYRLPHGESIVYPPSHCPSCQTNIKPWDNIPIVSYLWLRAACRHCGKRIQMRSRWVASPWAWSRCRRGWSIPGHPSLRLYNTASWEH